MQSYIRDTTGENIYLSDIVDTHSSGYGIAFKVTVPTSKKDIILNIWSPKIKAIVFNENNPRSYNGTGSTGGGNRNSAARNQTFRNPGRKPTNW